jgi:hypothetical protein
MRHSAAPNLLSALADRLRASRDWPMRLPVLGNPRSGSTMTSRDGCYVAGPECWGDKVWVRRLGR